MIAYLRRLWRPTPQPVAQLTLRGADVAAIVAPPAAGAPDRGERHSRLWIGFCRRALADLAPGDARATGLEREIAIHSAMHPDDSRDAEYLAEHNRGA